jgi:VWFA-related protein
VPRHPLALLALTAASTLLHAQQPPDTDPTFSSGVNLVVVPVVVRNAKGEAIGNLRKEDFQLFDKGKPQTISRFSVDPQITPVIITGSDSDTAPNTSAAPKAIAIPTRFVAWLFDDVHLDPADLLITREAADRQLSTLDPGTRAGIFTTSGQNILGFTDDRAKLHETLSRLQPAPTHITGFTDCPDIGFQQANLMVNLNDRDSIGIAAAEYIKCNGPNPAVRQIVLGLAQNVVSINERDSMLAFDVMNALIHRMVSLPGTRTIVLISPGFLVTNPLRSREIDLMHDAIRAGIVLSSLNAQGLYALVPGGDASTAPEFFSQKKDEYRHDTAVNGEGIMAELANATGGTYFHNDNDLSVGLKQLAAPPEFVYMLGFSPQSLKLDGSFHPLKVTLTDAAKKSTPGYQLQAREGYFEQHRATKPAEREKLAREEIQQVFFAHDEIHDIPVRLKTQSSRTSGVGILVTVDIRGLHFRHVNGHNENTLTMVGGVFDHNGNYVVGTQKIATLKLSDKNLAAVSAAGISFDESLAVPPGTYMLRVIVHDSETQSMSAQNTLVTIE